MIVGEAIIAPNSSKNVAMACWDWIISILTIQWLGVNICELWLKWIDMDVLFDMIEGSLEVKLPTIWTDEKQSRAEAERRERSEEKEQEERRWRCAKR